MAADPDFDTAPWAHRMLALGVDWLACLAIAVLIMGGYKVGSTFSFITLAAFVVESTIFTSTLGGSFGQLATRLRVVRIDRDPRPLDPIRTLARQILIALFIPPMIFRPDGRGLHDLAVGTATTKLDTYRDLAHSGGKR